MIFILLLKKLNTYVNSVIDMATKNKCKHLFFICLDKVFDIPAIKKKMKRKRVADTATKFEFRKFFSEIVESLLELNAIKLKK